MLLVLPVHSGDLPLALLNLRLASRLDKRCPFPVLIAAPHGFDLSELEEAVERWSPSYSILRYDDWTGEMSWPRPQNFAWQTVARHIAALKPAPACWLWWEADATPLKPGWCEALANAYRLGGKPFAGHIVAGMGNGHLNGVALYPPDAPRYSTAAMLSRAAPFDRMLSRDVALSQITPLNHLIGHYLKETGRPAPALSADDLEQITQSKLVLYHGSSDGTLVRHLLGERVAPRARPSVRTLHLSLLSYNRLDLTRACLASLEAHTPHPYTLTVTDNASTDGSAEWLDAWGRTRPWVRIVHNKENLGYKEPHDSAFAHACSQPTPPEFFVILNNDVELGEGWFSRAVAAFDRSDKIALVGNTGVCCNLTSELRGTLDPRRAPEYIEGSLLAIRTALVAPLSKTLFSPHLDFIYCEDCDLSLRVREAGLAIATADLNCKHLYSQTVKSLDGAVKARIATALAHNLAWMRSRWSVYARRRDFRYQVLIKRRHAFGDVIDVTCITAALKRKWPVCEIDLHTDFPDVFRNNPAVRLAQQPPFKRPYDFRFDLDLAYERLPHLHTLEAYAKVCEVECPLEGELPLLYPSREDKRTAEQLLPPGKWALLHPGLTGWPGKDWPLDRWSELTRALHAMGYSTAVVGNGATVEGTTLDLRKRTSPQVLYSVMQRAALFIGLDSGPSHVAQAAKCPSVVLFGTVLAERKLFPAAPALGVQASPDVAPCVGEHHRLAPPIEHSTCTGACMRAISVEMVLEAVETMTR